MPRLRSEGWTYTYGKAGVGTFSDPIHHRVILDGDEQGHPIESANSVAHESGHALNPSSTGEPSGLTRAEFISKNVDAELEHLLGVPTLHAKGALPTEQYYEVALMTGPFAQVEVRGPLSAAELCQLRSFVRKALAYCATPLSHALRIARPHTAEP